ncbi:TPA: hypothetical protein N0F65_011534 [Lagenidium giganteum]|uniref:Integrator complex subunit 5 C-terminal domain-containing protein n=1 Tax=Lagenidium giganteum TaxID=4803 RepID=A0AAV2Z8F6_9STRA|nr:TPA: hypothetical protein N0F65_011534 [Lagenidium giganteum]
MSFDATLAAVQQRSVYSQLMGVVRRAILGAPEEAKSVLLTQLLEWCTEVAPEPASQWLWTFVFVAQLDSFLVQDFLMRQALVRPSSAVSLDAPLQYLATAHPAQTVDIVRDLLEELAANSVQHVDNQPVNVVLSNLITFVARSDATVRACGDSVQWIVTSELIRQLWLNLHQLSDSSSAMEVESHGHASRPSQRSMGALLLDCIARQSSNLGSGAFHLVLLLQSLQKQIPSGDISASNSDLPARAAQFHRQLQDAAEKEESKALVTSIYRFLPYVCRSVVRQLHNADVSDHEQAAVEHWTRWLVIMAARVSRSAIVQALVEAELMISEVPSDHTRQGDSSTDSALCDLLTHVIGSTTSEYTAFITSLMELCRTSPSARRQCRLLELLRSLLAANKTEALPSKHHDTTLLPMQMATLGADVDDAAALVQRLTLAQPWETSWATFESWKTTSGAAFWSSLLDLACSSDDGVASQALELLASTPFASLEDPVWQYQCLHKLTLVFFHLLRRFRMELVQCAASTSPSTPSTTALEQLHGRLEVLKVLFARLVAVDGGVTHYPSSVFAVFVALWLDLLLSTTSPTSIPTHFPNRVNFDDAPGAGIYARHVIRAERTVSSKCTNLQASKVITHVPETLVYRKALDATWGHEMDAATTCGVYVVDLLVRLLRTHHQAPVAANDGTSANNADQHLERRTKAIVDLLLERAIPCCGLQSDDAYKETLPNRSTFDMDLRIEQWLHHFPAFLPLLRAVVETSAALQLTQAWRLLPLLKSALVVLLGHWNSVKGGLEHDNMDVPPYMRNRNQLRLTTELVRILGLTGWLPTSLANTADLLPLTTPADIRAILFSCWSFLADHPPSKNAAIGSSSHINGIAPAALDGFLIPVRKALHRNIRRVGARYPQFMC